MDAVTAAPRPRYAFSGFVLSPARRVLLRDGLEVPLIPRYLDLLLLLALNDREGVLSTDWEAANRKESHALANQIGQQMCEVRALADKLVEIQLLSA